MRLIDADKLKKHYSWWGRESEKKKLFDEIVNQQKVVDAIPVNWIIKWSAEHMEDYGTITISKMLEDWKNDKANSQRNFGKSL